MDMDNSRRMEEDMGSFKIFEVAQVQEAHVTSVTMDMDTTTPHVITMGMAGQETGITGIRIRTHLEAVVVVDMVGLLLPGVEMIKRDMHHHHHLALRRHPGARVSAMTAHQQRIKTNAQVAPIPGRNVTAKARAQVARKTIDRAQGPPRVVITVTHHHPPPPLPVATRIKTGVAAQVIHGQGRRKINEGHLTAQIDLGHVSDPGTNPLQSNSIQSIRLPLYILKIIDLFI